MIKVGILKSKKSRNVEIKHLQNKIVDNSWKLKHCKILNVGNEIVKEIRRW